MILNVEPTLRPDTDQLSKVLMKSNYNLFLNEFHNFLVMLHCMKGKIMQTYLYKFSLNCSAAVPVIMQYSRFLYLLWWVSVSLLFTEPILFVFWFLFFFSAYSSSDDLNWWMKWMKMQQLFACRFRILRTSAWSRCSTWICSYRKITYRNHSFSKACRKLLRSFHWLVLWLLLFVFLFWLKICGLEWC